MGFSFLFLFQFVDRVADYGFEEFLCTFVILSGFLVGLIWVHVCYYCIKILALITNLVVIIF